MLAGAEARPVADVRDTHACFFFFNDTATTEIYTLSLHDVLPICMVCNTQKGLLYINYPTKEGFTDRKSTRLNSSHLVISYAVFCLKKKKTTHGRGGRKPDIPARRTHHRRPVLSTTRTQ